MRFIFATLAVVALVSCGRQREPLSRAALIPRPVSVADSEGTFRLTDATAIRLLDESPELRQIGDYLAQKLRPATGFPLLVATGNTTAAGSIRLGLSSGDTTLGREGYRIIVNDTAAIITANYYDGVFRGIQTLMQLLPAGIEASSVQSGPWEIAAGAITDYPAYAFRSSMLDVSRHFFDVKEVKKYIDQISAYKMNVLHLHLSDDQGWRIEIKSWPNLTAHGGSTEVGGGRGGFYTQEEYKDIVRYAQSRYVTIIPEIDMPGHTNAALASYAELNCNDTAPALYTKTDVGFSTLCVKKDITYKFVDDVVRELAAITPGPYIHLGGDESHATSKEDYLTFVNKIQGIPKKYGKRMIGWEEVAQANLDSSTVVQFWTDPKYANEAVQKGATMILSPASKVYLDMKYDSTTTLGQDWAARIEIDSSYLWSLSTAVPGLSPKNILGVEAPLWTETLKTPADIEYMVFPRLIGIAEIGWSREEGKSWDDFRSRLGRHGARLKAMGVNFYKSRQIPWQE